MTAPYDHDALWLKAKLFLNRAMDEENVRSFDERALWATVALELLAKAALARVSPLLIAEPTEEGINLLIASGVLEGDAQFVSVRAKTVFVRCQRAFRPFSTEEAQNLTRARNGYLHGAAAAFTQMPEEAWWPLYWRQAVILNSACERQISDLVGHDRESIVENHLVQNRKNIEHRTEMLIEQAKLRLAQHNAGTLPAKVAKLWQPGLDRSVSMARSEGAACPACGQVGVIEGEIIRDREWTTEAISQDDYEIVVTLTVFSEHFSCANCGLVLDRPELIEEAGLDTLFAVQGAEDDLPDFEGDYGND